MVEQERVLVHLQGRLPAVDVLLGGGHRLRGAQVNAHGVVALRDQPADVVAVDIAVHLRHIAEVLLAGQIHEGVGVAGEEHIVLRRTPVLQESVQALNGALFSFRGHGGAGDINGSMAQGAVRKIAGTLKELIRQNSRSATIQSRCRQRLGLRNTARGGCSFGLGVLRRRCGVSRRRFGERLRARNGGAAGACECTQCCSGRKSKKMAT